MKLEHMRGREISAQNGKHSGTGWINAYDSLSVYAESPSSTMGQWDTTARPAQPLWRAGGITDGETASGQIVMPVLRDEAAPVEEADPVRLFRFVEEVGRQEDGRPAPRELAQERAEASPPPGRMNSFSGGRSAL